MSFPRIKQEPLRLLHRCLVEIMALVFVWFAHPFLLKSTLRRNYRAECPYTQLEAPSDKGLTGLSQISPLGTISSWAGWNKALRTRYPTGTLHDELRKAQE